MDEVSVALFGSTGSVGTQTLEVIRASEGFKVEVLTAHSNVDLLAQQAREFKPRAVSLATEDASLQLQLREQLVDLNIELVPNSQLQNLAGTSDIAVNAIVGFAGLSVTVGCLQAGKRLGLANKESMIAAGPLVQKVRHTPGAEILPIDSEHAAIHQAMAGKQPQTIQLTASGGPFRTREDLSTVTLKDALKHPNWDMGKKITIDSSTLMNKGLEVIEAYELFGAPAGSQLQLDDIQVVVHPQSIVHSMVTFSDGSTIAQLSEPDMCLPIAYALNYPDRSATSFGAMDFTRAFTLDFEPPNIQKFPCLELAYAAARQGGAAPAWINAANEVAVEAFCEGVISWIDISGVIAATLDKFEGGIADGLPEVIEQDRRAREVATALIETVVS